MTRKTAISSNLSEQIRLSGRCPDRTHSNTAMYTSSQYVETRQTQRMHHLIETFGRTSDGTELSGNVHALIHARRVWLGVGI